MPAEQRHGPVLMTEQIINCVYEEKLFTNPGLIVGTVGVILCERGVDSFA